MPVPADFPYELGESMVRKKRPKHQRARSSHSWGVLASVAECFGTDPRAPEGRPPATASSHGRRRAIFINRTPTKEATQEGGDHEGAQWTNPRCGREWKSRRSVSGARQLSEASQDHSGKAGLFRPITSFRPHRSGPRACIPAVALARMVHGLHR